MSSPVLQLPFKPASWLINIDLIRRLVTKHSTIIVLMAERSSGKSSFIDLMKLKFDTFIKTLLIKVEAHSSSPQILEQLAKLFDIDSNSVDFVNFFENIDAAEYATVVVIDDAHFISSRDLYDLMISYQKCGAQKNIHLMFSTDTVMHSFFEDRALGDFNDSIHMLDPGSLNESEARTYLIRYTKGKQLDFNLLSSSAFAKFYEQTQGNIAKLNLYVSSLKPAASRKKVASSSSKWMLASLVIAATIGAWTFMQKQVNGIDVQAHIAQNNDQKSLQRANDIAPVKLSRIPPFFVRATESAVASAPYQASTNANSHDIAYTEQESEVVKLNNEYAEVDKVVMGPGADEIMADAALTNHASSSVVVSTVPTSGYTIQLSVAKTIEEIQEIMQANKLSYQAVNIYHVVKENNKWYVLTIGSFEEPSKASLSLKQLSDKLQNLHPLVRPFNELASIG